MRYELGMVLSGGAARGLAHVGVLRALTEEGIAPDVLAGSSAGAIVAALYAAGYSADEMLEFFIVKSPFRLSKLALAKPGIFDTAKTVSDFLEYFPDDSFEALGKPIHVVATDLIDARAEVFSSGPLVPAILASASTPLVFTPTEIEGRLFSDGGITDNFPTEPIEKQCRALLGVYASPLRSISRRDLHSSLAVVERALEIGMFHNSELKFDRCGLVLCPPELSRFGSFDIKHFPEIAEIGYHAARGRMAEIRSLVDGAAGA